MIIRCFKPLGDSPSCSKLIWLEETLKLSLAPLFSVSALKSSSALGSSSYITSVKAPGELLTGELSGSSWRLRLSFSDWLASSILPLERLLMNPVWAPGSFWWVEQPWTPVSSVALNSKGIEEEESHFSISRLLFKGSQLLQLSLDNSVWPPESFLVTPWWAVISSHKS